MATIELREISKEYRNDEMITSALINISLIIGKGEFVAIMGASGSGKTTLLNIIGCMDIPTGGTYLLDGEDLGGAKEKRLSSLRGKKISFVFQNFALIGDDTVFEKRTLESLAKEGQLMSYMHKGFWQCMDTKREMDMLEHYLATETAPWKKWRD